MSFSFEIQSALKEYDQRKGVRRYVFGDQSAIKALRGLPETDQSNIFKIYQCFLGNPSKEQNASHFVFEDLIHSIMGSYSFTSHTPLTVRRNYFNVATAILDFFIKAELATQNNSDLIKKHLGYISASNFHKILNFLDSSALLNQKNLDTFFDLPKTNLNLPNLFSILTALSTSRLLSQENLDRSLQLHRENNFLSTEPALRTIWTRIPEHLFTQAVFEQLIVLSRTGDPEQQITRYVNQLLGINADAQNTHRASVHQSVSASATRLFKRYGNKITEDNLKIKLQEIGNYIATLSDDSQKNIAAKRCIKRITEHSFTDPGSELTTSQLLALTFLALHDDGQRVGTLSDAKEQFIEGLYEIQRGYNLSETGFDNSGRDKPICAAGTFNKLIEKLEGIHPDANVLHITPAIASLKLPIVVRDVALDYLSNLATLHTVEDLLRFTHLIDQIHQDECLEPIWDKIKTKIADRMFDEFASLYKSKADPKFTDLVDSGQYIKLKDLSRFQKQILVSPGYKQYCSKRVWDTTGFFLARKAAVEYLSERRHDNPEAQQTYDRHFALIPFNN